MLCCLGLFAGLAIGTATGIPWMPYVAASAGAGAGVVGDVKIIGILGKKGLRKENERTPMPLSCCIKVATPIFNKRKKAKDKVPI